VTGDPLRAKIDRRRRDAGLTWRALAERIRGDPVWVTAALLGQHPLSEEQAQRTADALDLTPEDAVALTEIPPSTASTRHSVYTAPRFASSFTRSSATAS